MAERQPTAQDIRELVAFLPRLYGETAAPSAQWPETEEDEDGVLIIHPPKYSEAVQSFMETIVNRGWMGSYDPTEVTNMLADEAAVGKAKLPEIRRMLTAVVRGERFCDGWWANVIESGQVRQLLERLAEIEQGSVDDPRK